MSKSYDKAGWVERLDDLSHRHLPRWLAQRLCPWTTPPYPATPPKETRDE